MKTMTSSSDTIAPTRLRGCKHGLVFWTTRVLLGLLTLIIGLAALGASYQALATAIDKRTYPRPANWSMWAATACICIAPAPI